MSPRQQQVLSMLATGSVTSLEAGAVHKIRQLPARILELKRMGFDIRTHLKRDAAGQRYASYSLEGVN